MNAIKRETTYLYLTQISNMVIPLLLIPYLTSVLGVEYFGKLSYSQVVSMIATFFVDFGFNLSAARDVGVNLKDKKRLSGLFFNVQCTKGMIFLTICVLGGMLSFLLPQQKIDNQLLLIGVLSSISSVLTPGWFLQGIGRNSLLAFSSLFSRVVAIIFIFLFVRSKSDLLVASCLQLFSPALAGLVVLFLVFKLKYIKIRSGYFSLTDCKALISDSFHNFSASFITLGFTYFNPLLIKYFFGDAALGVYSLADKLVSVLRQLYSPAIQANFSHICQLFKKEVYSEIKNKAVKLSLFFLSLSVCALLGDLFLGDWLIPIFFAKGYSTQDIFKIKNLISIMIVTQFVVSLSMILVNLIIIPSGNSRYLKRFYAIAFVFYFSILFPMAKLFYVYGVAFSITLVELFIILMFFVFVKTKKIL